MTVTAFFGSVQNWRRTGEKASLLLSNCTKIQLRIVKLLKELQLQKKKKRSIWRNTHKASGILSNLEVRKYLHDHFKGFQTFLLNYGLLCGRCP